MGTDADTQAGLRVDKWLWFTRFFKSRALATEAVAGGRVHVNGERAKPARLLKVNDELRITRDEVRFDIIVQGMPKRRGPAAEAQTFYVETPASIELREQQRAQRRLAPPAPTGRPDKHGRRALRDLRRG